MKDSPHARLDAFFFKSAAGNEPARDWLKGLADIERKAIGDDIRLVQIGWPLGMPLVRKLEEGIWEIRTDLPSGIARILFTMSKGRIALLHGFMKKTQKTPPQELQTARTRRKSLLKAEEE